MKTIERNTFVTRTVVNKNRGKSKAKSISAHRDKLKKSLGWLKTDIDAAKWEREIRASWD